jgi:hypothetical protein
MAKYKLEKPYSFEVPVGDTHYEDGILFLKYDYGMEPIAYDVKEEPVDGIPTYVGLEIEPELNDLFFLFILFVRKCSDRYDITTGSSMTGFLETWQWVLAFNEIKDLASLQSKDYVIAVSRQGEQKLPCINLLNCWELLRDTITTTGFEKMYVNV